MEILDCVIDTNSAIYTVKTTGGNVFHHMLSTDTPTKKVIEILTLLSDHIDKLNQTKLKI
ncbi:hypothetical protein ACN9U4_04235 [Staphylococcus caprae]|uniref:hypothetical protein n=1 Tax=Staphylococcus caprae TaxID=29380 RepID=UPI000E69E22D|nr:hypothetical protein [Staphylococcus caprae]MBU5271064.1 hypothetical protein [Staphylococcus caprae]MDK6297295.1 hypothetical protein [Staphylococcus caprae]MDK7232594.1 hypothetical protein [Staphylococcus caprae]RIM34523.1 hypothetical protein BU631_06565 [Staphylococcus caprae]